MTDYYLSAAGNDSNTGLSASSPWKTVTRLNASLVAGIGRNDSVYFNRGDTFYGLIRPPTGLNPALVGELKFGAYGDGETRPVITGYKILNTATGWIQHDANTWKLDYSAANAGITYTGYDHAQSLSSFPDGDVGFLKVDGVIKGVKRSTLVGLVDQWDFYSSGTTLYVRSAAKPTTMATDIRCTIDGDGITMRNAITVKDLAFIGHGGCGTFIGVSGTPTARNRVLGCEFGEIGGSYLDGFLDGTVRYGNGIQVWTACSDVVMEHNIIHDCFDVAYTIQGGVVGAATTFKDIIFRRNLTYRSTQAEEYWYEGLAGATNGFVNCVSEFNTHLFAGYGWGSEVRPNPEVRCFQLSYKFGDDGQGYVADLTLRHNIYYDARGAFAYYARVPTGLDSNGNVILLRPGTKMGYQDTQTIEQAAAWAAAKGREQNSIFGVLPATSNVNISNADVEAAIASLDQLSPMGQLTSHGLHPVHAPWQGVTL